MKKNLFSFMAFLILILGSCQESTYVEDIQEYPTNVKLSDPVNKVDNGIVARLQAYNDSLNMTIEQTSSVNGTSSTRELFKKWLNISVKDFLGRLEGLSYGVAVGALAGPAGPEVTPVAVAILTPLVGAYRSYEAAYPNKLEATTIFQQTTSSYIKMKKENRDYSNYYPSVIKLDLPMNKVNLQTEGAQHNLILDNLVNKTYDLANFKYALDKGIITEEEYSVLTNRNFISVMYNLANPSRIEHIPSRFDFYTGPASDAIVNLYIQAIQNFSNSYSDVQKISNRYIAEMYNSSELEEEQKDNITSSIGVMASSIEYWKVFDQK